MGGLFNPEGKFAQYGGKLWDLIWLNILVIVCMLPVVTMGAAFSAMHYILLKIYRNEEGNITSTFFKAFRNNFKQATAISLICGVTIYLLIVSAGIAVSLQMGILKYLLIVMLVLICGVWNWSLIFQSRYQNTVPKTIGLGVMALMAHPVRTVLMTILFLLPIALMLAGIENFIIIILVGFTMPGFIQVAVYHSVLQKLEMPREQN